MACKVQVLLLAISERSGDDIILIL